MRRLTTSVVLMLLVAPAAVAAQQAPITMSAELSYKTKYLFAGIPFAADDVTQGQVTLGAGPLTFNAFTTYDHEAGEITEGDVWGDYYGQLNDRWGVFVGGGIYNFKDEDGFDATPELYGGLVMAAPFNPTLYVAHDFDIGDGTHVVLTVSESVPITFTGIALTLTSNLEYNDGYYREGSNLSFWDLIVSLSLPAGPFTVSPMFQLQRAIAEDFTDEEVFGLVARISS